MAAGGGAGAGAETVDEGGCALMLRWMFLLGLSATFLTATVPAPGSLPTNCTYDKDAMMELSQGEFDQNPDNGWRRVAVAGCEGVAADLIRDWRTHHQSQDIILYWHEGQLRAIAGQNQEAIVLFDKSRKTAIDDRGMGWSIYVDGTIAFLQSDKRALKKAKRALVNLPRPADLGRTVDINGNPVEIEWPPNLHILDGFSRCWGQSYKQAYACPPAVK
jgi:hypothetical protein